MADKPCDLSERHPGGSSRFRPIRRAAIVALVVLMVPVLPFAYGAAELFVEDIGAVSASAHGDGDDGLWLGHAWVDGRHSASDVDSLVSRVREAGIRDVFVHVGPLTARGTLDPGLRPNARWLVAALHQRLPNLRVQAWLGGVAGAGGINLDNSATRENIVTAAGQVLRDGFDGIHYDLEPVPDGDPGLLALLAQTGPVTAAAHAVLSIAADQIEPIPGLARPAQWVLGRSHFWSTDYLRAIASTVNMVAIMAYDSGVPIEAAYSGYIRVQTELALETVRSSVTLLIGLPAYHTDEPGHTDAETVAAAVRGVRLAVDGGIDRPFGVALYADFSATPADWDAYQTGWVRPG